MQVKRKGQCSFDSSGQFLSIQFRTIQSGVSDYRLNLRGYFFVASTVLVAGKNWVRTGRRVKRPSYRILTAIAVLWDFPPPNAGKRGSATLFSKTISQFSIFSVSIFVS